MVGDTPISTPGGNAVRGGAWLYACALFVVCFLFPAILVTSHAGEERFDYDPLGRLIRAVDEQGRVTEYVYDPAGNLLQVITAGTAAPPTITAITPENLRRGESRQFIVTGSGLTGVRINLPDPGLSLSNVQPGSTEIRFTLTASSTAVLGPQPINFSSAAGSTDAAVTVNPVLPTVTVVPAPLAVPPDETPRQFTIRLSSADNLDHVINLSTANTAVATVSPASLTIPAGQTEAQASITGHTGGQTPMTLASTTLGNTLVPVFVTAEFAGINTSLAPLVGVVLETEPPPKPPITITPFGAPHLGVVVGSYLNGMNPQAVTVGTGPTDVTIFGKGLDGVTGISVVPADGVTLGAHMIAPDGNSISVPVTVDEEAPATLRQVVLTAGTARIPSSAPEADRLYVALPPPEVTSVDPLFALPGTLSQTLVIRGRYFQELRSIAITPANGIIIGSQPVVNSTGTEITVQVAISPVAATGPRVVTVTTVGGASSAVASPFNTFTLVNEFRETFTPFIAPLVGVVLEAEPTPTQSDIYLKGTSLGVAVGSVVTGLSPTAGVIGETMALTINGYALQNVTAVELFPNTGITVGPPMIDVDGRSLTVQLDIAADAPRTLRTVRVLAGSALLPSAPAEATQFLVTVPQPRIDSVSPLYLQVGQPLTTLTVRGANFQNLQQVRIVPPDDITLGTPSVNTSGTEIVLNISAAANAVLGPRIVVVETAGGETAEIATIANTLTLTDNAGTTYTPIMSALVGVVLQAPPPPPVETTIGPVAAPNLGVVLEAEQPPPATQDLLIVGSHLGVALGPTATRSEPSGLPVGGSATLTINGFALGEVTAISLMPTDGVTVGPLTISPDGAQITASIEVAADAPVGWREIALNTVSGTVPFSDAAVNRFYVASGLPTFDSIDPILARQGEVLTLTVRGEHLLKATAVTAEPPEGITFTFPITVNATGTELTVPLQIAPDAPLGSRVIRVTTPGGISTEVAEPANTFTVFPP